MFSRRLTMTLLAALIAVAHLHCVFEYELPALSYRVSSAQGPVVPQPMKHCHNEAGCICKGATLVRATSVELAMPEVSRHYQFDAQQTTLAPSLRNSEFGVPAERSGHLPAGKILRTQLSSLVI